MFFILSVSVYKISLPKSKATLYRFRYPASRVHNHIVRRRLAGASWRGIAAHVANRVWWINGVEPVPSNGDGPRRGFADGNAQRGDRFEDPFSQYAGRGDWRAADYDSTRL